MLIVSMMYTSSQDGVLGHNNTIPWKVYVEMNRNDAVTLNKTLIMGRNTWEALPLSARSGDIIVLSSQPPSDLSVKWAVSLEAAVEMASQLGLEDVVIVGGAMLFNKAMDICHIIYKSTLLIEVKGNVPAPVISPKRYKLVWVKNIKGSPSYSYQTFISRELLGHKFTDDYGVLIRK